MSPIVLSFVLFHTLASLALLAIFTAENSRFRMLPGGARFPERTPEVPTVQAAAITADPVSIARAA